MGEENSWYVNYVKDLEQGKYHFKEVTNEDIEKTEFDDIAFYMEAEPGAMGEPGGIEFVLFNKKFYHSNTVQQYEITEKFFDKFPQIKNIGMFLGYASRVPKEFAFFNLGMGNYLFVRNKFTRFFKKKVKTPEDFRHLYMNWKDFALEALK